MNIPMVRADILPGIYQGVPNEAYHAGPGVSKSGLWELHTKSPFHFQFAPREEKNFFDLGEAGHIAVLEPETLEARVYRGPEDRRGNKWTDAQEFCRIEGKVCLTSKDFDKALMIRDTIHANATLNALITGSAAMVEASGYWIDPVTGELCRSRPATPSTPKFWLTRTRARAPPSARPFPRFRGTCWHTCCPTIPISWRLLAPTNSKSWTSPKRKRPYSSGRRT